MGLPPSIISLNLFYTFSHVPDLTYFPKSDTFMYICLVLITLLVNRLAVTIYLVELVDPRKHYVALKWLWLWVNIMAICDLLSNFDFDQILSREQRTVQNLQHSQMQFFASSTQLSFFSSISIIGAYLRRLILLEFNFNIIGC